MILPLLLLAVLNPSPKQPGDSERLRVGAASAELLADDSMPIAGGIGPGKAQGQEGKLRVVATVIQGPPDGTKAAIVACDILMIGRKYLDAASREIERQTGIPFDNILINCTHTHHAPSTVHIHGYDVIEPFALQVQHKIVEAVTAANDKLAPASMHFVMSKENTVGQNSRLLLSDGMIYWVGSMADAVRPTGPFDSDFPVMAFRRENGPWSAVIFGHSTHTIGVRAPGKRSPSFYGLAAQVLDSETGAVTTFIEGASGSTHLLKIGSLGFPQVWIEAERRIINALRYGLDQAAPMKVERVAVLKKEVTVRVRRFDEKEEEGKVMAYCRKRIPQNAESVAAVFRRMRAELASHQGEARRTWIQVMRIGDVAIVGVPAEFFTQLGIDIKKRSPFKHTIIAELANDYVGYVGNRDAYALGGYQLWMGHHSWTEPGTGEMLVNESVGLLRRLRSAGQGSAWRDWPVIRGTPGRIRQRDNGV